MEFQLSKEKDWDSSGTNNTSSGNPNPKQYQTNEGTSSFDSDFSDDNFDPAAEDTVFIANRYNQTTPIDNTVSSASILTEKEVFLPILMFFGAFFQILSIISIILQLRSPSFDLNQMQASQSSLSSANLLSFLGSACIIADAIILHKKKISGSSLIVWAIIFPIVYYFKRCKSGGPSSVFAFLIVAAQLVLVVFTANATIQAGISAMGIKMNDSGLYGVSMASSRMEALPNYGISVDGWGDYYYDRIIESNINNPTYEYIAATTSQPALLSVQGTAIQSNTEETIIINFNYNTMEIVSITMGGETAISSNDLYHALFDLLKNTPSGPSTQSVQYNMQ